MPEKRGTSILFACAQYIFKTLVSFCFFCTWAGVFLYFSAMALISEFSSSEGSSGLALQLKTSSSIVLQDSHTSLLIILLTIKIQRYISSKLWINWDLNIKASFNADTQHSNAVELFLYMSIQRFWRKMLKNVESLINQESECMNLSRFINQKWKKRNKPITEPI